MLVVTDIDKSVDFYKKVFGLHVIMDFGANKTLTGGLALQTLETWQEFIGTDNVSFGSNSSEVYFEEDNFGMRALQNTRFAFGCPDKWEALLSANVFETIQQT